MDFSTIFQFYYRLSRQLVYFALCIGTLAIVVLSVTACQSGPNALPQHPHIQAYFNYNQANSYTDPYRQIKRPGDDLEKILVEQINQAKVSVDVAVQELRLPNIAKALIDRKAAGVKVRLILENRYSRGWSEYSTEELAKFNSRESEKYLDFVKFADRNGDGKLSDAELDQSDAIRAIKKANLEWIDDTADGSKGRGLMHHKFAIVDRKIVLFGSANFTLSDMHGDFATTGTLGNANNLVKIENQEIANLFTEEFNLMWGDGPGGKPDSLFGVKKPHRRIAYVLVDNAQIRVKFSPDKQDTAWEQTSNGLIGTGLAGATKSADMALFVFSTPKLSDVLELREQTGVKIRVLVDPQFAYREYSSTLDMWGFVSTLDCKSEDGHAWVKPIATVGAPSLATGDLLHHKFAVIDGNLVITGSHNWSNAANYTNDETLLVIQNNLVAAHYQREFDRLYKNATFGPTAKLSQEAPRTCPLNNSKEPAKEPKKQPPTPEELPSPPQ
ncbi:phospholipase D-like domain-containing protein [Tumidithrix elongata RA019]|uniref:phospholipase D n=1 Tax=Tumidithrix elongata BACA0141 TaxID=2716417 RepID=A0AAW9Q1A9_9CYAN|nr:phospholipase D-like domain-containing protein [Tumidithrix elongata RA019]